MKLSIVILVCDKDYKMLPCLSYSIDKHIKVEHEICVCDNREKHKGESLGVHGIKVFNAKENLFIFEGRRQTVLNCASGDYVWFIDADDDVTTLDEFNFDEDLICFNYVSVNSKDKSEKPCNNPYHVAYTANKSNFFTYSWRNVTKNMLWNKFIKRDLLVDVYSHVPDGMKIVLMEDCLLNILLLSKIKTLRFETGLYYKYYHNAGDSQKDEYTDIKPLERLLTGYDTALGLLNIWLTPEMQDASGINAGGFYNGTAEFLIKKIPLCDENTRPKFIDLLEKYYTRDYLRVIYNKMDNVIFTDEARRRIETALLPKPLVILGKGENEYSIKDIHSKGCEVWTVGTYAEDGADRYYEWHGEEVTKTINPNRELITEYPTELLKKYDFLPVNNSIAIMLLIAFESGYKHIEILGCQMNTKEEYIKQRPALAIIVGWLMGQGLEINWIGSPENNHYCAK